MAPKRIHEPNPRVRSSTVQWEDQYNVTHKTHCLVLLFLNLLWAALLSYLLTRLLQPFSPDGHPNSTSSQCLQEEAGESSANLFLPCHLMPPHFTRESNTASCEISPHHLKTAVDSFVNIEFARRFRDANGSLERLATEMILDVSKINSAGVTEAVALPWLPEQEQGSSRGSGDTPSSGESRSGSQEGVAVGCGGRCLQVSRAGVFFLYLQLSFLLPPLPPHSESLQIVLLRQRSASSTPLFQGLLPACLAEASTTPPVLPGLLGGLARLQVGDSVQVRTSHPQLLSRHPQHHKLGVIRIQ